MIYFTADLHLGHRYKTDATDNANQRFKGYIVHLGDVPQSGGTYLHYKKRVWRYGSDEYGTV